jgi:hypothetical protein
VLFYDHHVPISGALESCMERRLVKKPSLKISLDEFDGDSDIVGQQTFNLIAREGNDSQYLLEVLAQRVTNAFGVEASLTGHARLCLNGVYEGLFSLVEEADTQRFLRQHFPGEDDGGYWKIENDGDQVWRERWDDSGAWRYRYIPKAGTDKDDPGRLRELLILGNLIEAGGSPAEIEAGITDLVDVDQWFRQIAVELALPDYDNQWGHHKNYLLYDHPDGFRIVPYDRDLAFVDIVAYEGGVCPGDILGGNPCWASDRKGPTIAQYLMDTREDQYLATVQALVDEVLIPGELIAWIGERQEEMRPWIAADRYYQPDSPACALPECAYFTVDGWESRLRWLTSAITDRVRSITAQLGGDPTCSNPCDDR